MGTSTDGQICYGIHIGEDMLPWQNNESEDDEFDSEEWWRNETGFVRQHRELFDANGGYIDGKEPPREEVSAYFQEQRDWLEAHPLPFELVNACSIDYPDWILAVPGTVREARRGCPEAFDPSDLVVPEDTLAAFREFVAKYGIEGDERWYLSSYWG